MELKNLKVKSLSYGLAIALAAAPAPALAANHTFGNAYYEVEDMNFNTYVVEEKDNASKISSKVVSYFIKRGEVPAEDLKMFKDDPDTRCRYWPAIANLNRKNGKFRIHPGDVIKFPETYEELVNANYDAKQQEWYKVYCSQEHYRNYVYIDKKEVIKKIKEVKREMHESANVDDAHIEAYLRLIGGDATKYIIKDGAKLFGDDDIAFYAYCPTNKEIEREMNRESNKTKKR